MRRYLVISLPEEDLARLNIFISNMRMIVLVVTMKLMQVKHR